MDIGTPVSDEHARMQTLRLYSVLDTDAEPAFDDLTELAASVMNAPIGLVTLIDDRRQWFKSRHGLDAEETPREHAFCAHTILQDEPFVIDDAHTDRRFADNPLVVGEPFIRFYAGAPLTVADGSRLGSLCVVDHVPRVMADEKIKTLEVLRDAVVAQLELRRLLQHNHHRDELLTLCAWCERVRTGSEAQDAASWVAAGRYLEKTRPVTHGICPSCRAEMLADN